MYMECGISNYYSGNRVFCEFFHLVMWILCAAINIPFFFLDLFLEPTSLLPSMSLTPGPIAPGVYRTGRPLRSVVLMVPQVTWDLAPAAPALPALRPGPAPRAGQVAAGDEHALDLRAVRVDQAHADLQPKALRDAEGFNVHYLWEGTRRAGAERARSPTEHAGGTEP